MSSNLIILSNENGDEITYSLSGQIDEDANLDSIIFENKNKIIFDLNNVVMINSCGIRDWVEFQNKIPCSVSLVYKNCPQVIIEQVNIIKGFIKEGGIVESFYAPYFNPETDEEVKILITPDEVHDSHAPSKYSESGVELEFDEIEQQYFNFLSK